MAKAFASLPDRAVVSVRGDDARSFLQGLVTNDVDLVGSDRAIYAALLSPQGKFLHDFFMIAHDGAILLECEQARSNDLIRRLSMFRLRAAVEMVDITDTWLVGAAFGDGLPDALDLPADAGAARAFHDGVMFVDPRLAALGVRAIIPASVGLGPLSDAGLESAAFADYDRWRLEHGVPDGSRDILVDKSFLLESNFEELNGIDFNKGCYVGQENTTRQKRRGTVRRRLMRVDIDGPAPAPGTPITVGGRDAGTMRSARDHVGIAQIRLDYLQDESAHSPFEAAGARLTPVKPDWANF